MLLLTDGPMGKRFLVMYLQTDTVLVDDPRWNKNPPPVVAPGVIEQVKVATSTPGIANEAA